MKNILFFLFVLLFFIVNQGCSKEDFSANYGKLEFSFIAENQGFKSETLEEAKSIIISVEDTQANSIVETEKIELYNFNGSYISKPISLKPGHYKLVQFHVLDQENNVIYSSPLAGSVKASLVQVPLPIDFKIEKDAVTKLNPEVLSTKDSRPEDFGYLTFTFNIVKTIDFLVSVFIYNPDIQNFELTSTLIKVTGNEPSFFSDSLKAITNKVTVRDGSSEYLIEIFKNYYESYRKTFTADSLKAFFNDPLIVILYKSTEIPGLKAHYPFEMNMNDESGNNLHGNDYGASGYANGIRSFARIFTNDPAYGVPATDYATIPNVINSEEFTINLWAKFNYAGNHQSLVYLSTGQDWTKANFWLFTSPDMKLSVILNGLDLRSIDYSHDAYKYGYFNDAFLSSKSLDYDRFYNITCTFKNSVVEIYVDGELYAKYLNVYRTVGNPDVPILLGVCPKPGLMYYPLVGRMDELKFFNRALTHDEIIRLKKL